MAVASATKGKEGQRAAIVAGLRTPFAKQGTAYIDLLALALGQPVCAELLERTELDPAEIEQIVYGQVIPAVRAPKIAREIVLGTGIVYVTVGQASRPVRLKDVNHAALRSGLPHIYDKMIEQVEKGRKNGRGFYRYEREGEAYRRKGVDPQKRVSDEEIAERCIVVMVNEAARCYGDGVLRSARDGDVGAVFGLGFPAFLGGPFHYVDDCSADAIVEQLEGYQKAFGARFKPAPVLKELAAVGLGFYDEGAPRPSGSDSGDDV